MAKKEAVTFFQGRKPAIVWDAKKDQSKFEFEKRFLTTSDTKLIELLDSLGYERFTGKLAKGWTKDGNVEGASTAALPATGKDLDEVVKEVEKHGYLGTFAAEEGNSARFTPGGK